MTRKSKALVGVAALCALAGVVGLWTARQSAEAADHNDPPARVTGDSADRAADIADVFAWHTDSGHTVFVLTYAGPNEPVAGQSATYDRDVLYGIHIDTDADEDADHDLWVRFGQSPSGNWGVQVAGIPGGDPATQAGPVETVNRIDGVVDGYFWSGLREDPFFFDLQGFRDTLTSGTVMMTSTRDFFAGKNSSAIVIQVRTADLNAGADNTFNVWATTARIGG